MRWKLTAWILAMAVIAGCSGENPLKLGKKRRGPATQFGGQLAPAPPPPPPPAPPKAPADEQGRDAVARPVPPPPPPPAKPDTPANVVREQATPGVTGKGQGYGPGLITTPIATYFITRERIVFDVQIASAMNMYKGIHGHFPKTHEEFMEKIIQSNSIRLPKLRPGDRYIYDPEKAAKMSTYDPKDPPLLVERAR